MGKRFLLAAAFLVCTCLPVPEGTGPGGRPDAGAADAGPASPSDAGLPPGEPLTAPVETWTWVDFPGSVCGNGAATGIAVNLTARSKDVVVYFAGGGACWDSGSCFVLKSAVNVETGYTGATFASDAIKSAAPFDRTDPANPFKDASFVYVPYCTGDLHAGDRLASYEVWGQWKSVHHRGARNVEEFLARLAPTFPGPRKVLVTGSSAGGYGAQLNYHRFAQAFPEAEVHALADCSQLVQPWGGTFGSWKGAWDLQSPPGCSTCKDSLPDTVDHLAKTWPQRRFGLLAYEEDGTLTLYFAYPLDGSFKAATNALLSKRYDPNPNARYFVLAGNTHVMLDKFTTLTGPGGVSLRDFVSGWATGDARWANVK